MHRNLTGRLLPVAMVGSYPRPRWYKRELHGMDFREAWLSVDWWEEWTDALKGCLADQAAAGLDIVTDGELYDYEVGGLQWQRYFVERIGGVHGHRRLDLARSGWAEPSGILQDMQQRSPLPPLIGRIERGPWRFADINRIARQFAGKPVKSAFVDPQRLVDHFENRYYPTPADGAVPQEMMADLMRAANAELRDLEASGCAIFQNDEPLFAKLGAAGASRTQWDEVLANHRAMLDGVGSSMQIWVHLCWGNPAGQRVQGRPPSYKGMMDRVFDAQFDVLNIEVWHDPGEIDLLAAVPKDRGVALGLINHRSTEVEDPEAIAAQVRRALHYIDPERLYLTTACGLQHQPRQNAFFKLKALADASAIVRGELTGTREPSLSAAT